MGSGFNPSDRQLDMCCDTDFKAVVNSFKQAIVIVDVHRSILDFNRYADEFAFSFFGRRFKRFDDVMQYLPKENHAGFEEGMTSALNGVAKELEAEISYGDNQPNQWIQMSFAPIEKEGVIVGATIIGWSIWERKQNELKIRHQLDFEQLIASISTRFITLEDISMAIQASLGEMGIFSGANRAYVFEIKEDMQTMSNTFEWCEEGVAPEIDNLKDLPTDIFPWWMEKLKNGEVINIKDVSQLSAVAKSEKEILESQGIKSVLVLPIAIKRALRGFIGFDNVETLGMWKHEDMTLLKVTSEIFSHAFERLAAENNLKEANLELEETLERLREAQAQIIQQGQLAGIGQLAAGVAHEINNPLGYVISNVDILKEDMQTLLNIYGAYEKLKGQSEMPLPFDEMSEELTELVKDIDDGLERVSEIVSGLSTFSKVDYIDEFTHYDLNAGIKNILIIAGNSLESNIDISMKLQNIPLITCIGSQINQVLLNMIMNSSDAIKSTKRGIGKMILETRSDQSNVYFKIEDTGGGIDEHIIDNIFKPFYSTKPVGDGVGLGLSIAYDIVVNKHKGKIDVVNHHGLGVAFEITLPIEQ